MKRNTKLRLRCLFVDENNGLNSLYKIYYKKVPFFLDVLSQEIRVNSLLIDNDPFSEDNFTISCMISSFLFNDIQKYYFDSLKDHSRFDMSVNGVYVIPLEFSSSVVDNTKAKGYEEKKRIN